MGGSRNDGVGGTLGLEAVACGGRQERRDKSRNLSILDKNDVGQSYEMG